MIYILIQHKSIPSAKVAQAAGEWMHLGGGGGVQHLERYKCVLEEHSFQLEAAGRNIPLFQAGDK